LLKQKAFWDEAHTAQVIKVQVDRRKAILEQNAAMLARQRALRGQKK
jgi:hypothetical protein